MNLFRFPAMCGYRAALLAAMLSIGLGMAGAEAQITLPDDFDTSHTYWDGSSTDVAGTIWTGVQSTGFVSVVDANMSNVGQLTLGIVEDPVSNGSDAPFDSAALYRDVTGNFDAIVSMPSLPPDVMYPTLSLAAWTADQVNGVHVDNVAAVGEKVRFRDMEPGDEFRLGIPRQPWFRLQRVGNDFSAYYGSDGVNWELIGTLNRDYGATLRVGLSAWNAMPVEFHGIFDDFSIDVVPEPSTLVLLLFGAMGLVPRWIRRHD